MRALLLLACCVPAFSRLLAGSSVSSSHATLRTWSDFNINGLLTVAAGYVADTICNGLFTSERSFDMVWNSECCIPALGIPCLFHYARALRLLSIDIDQRRKTVDVSALWYTAHAVYNSEHFGCQLKLPGQGVTYVQPHYNEAGHSAPWSNFTWPEALEGGDAAHDDVDYESLNAAIRHHFEDPASRAEAQPRALVVVHRGEIIAERYAAYLDMAVDTKLIGWSFSKSLTSALTGLRIADGKYNLSTPIQPRQWSQAQSLQRNVTVQSLLQQTSGIAWDEAYYGDSDGSEVTFGHDDTAAFVAGHAQAAPPGSMWQYSTGNPQLLQEKLRQSFEGEGGDAAYWAYPWERLFKPLGARSFVFATDAVGLYSGGFHSYACARDWARFGQLYLNGGTWQGRQVLPSAWVDFTRQSSQAARGYYGALWWLNPFPGVPSIPSTAFAAEGFTGQFILVVPDRDLVVVRLGFNPDDEDSDRLAAGVLGNVSAAVKPRTVSGAPSA